MIREAYCQGMTSFTLFRVAGLPAQGYPHGYPSSFPSKVEEGQKAPSSAPPYPSIGIPGNPHQGNSQGSYPGQYQQQSPYTEPAPSGYPGTQCYPQVTFLSFYFPRKYGCTDETGPT